MATQPGGNHPHKSQWLQIWLTTGNHLAGAVTRQMLLVELNHNLDLDVMQYCHCTGSLLGGGFWWKHSSWHSCCHDSCCCSSVGWWNGKHSPSWDTHLEVKTLCWGQSHYGLLHTALSVAHANREPAPLTQRVFCMSTNPKSLGMVFHDLGLLSHQGKLRDEEEWTIYRITLSIWSAYLSQHITKYKLKSKRGRNQKSHFPINLLCNCKQAINFFGFWSVNKVSGFCSMGIHWCLLSLMPLNFKMLLDIWLPRHFRNAWLNYTQL